MIRDCGRSGFRLEDIINESSKAQGTLFGNGYDWLRTRRDNELSGSIKRWIFLDTFSGIKCSNITPIHGVNATFQVQM